MKKVKSFLAGIAKEARRIRWVKGAEMSKLLGTVLTYAFFFAIALVVFDWLVIRLLQAINFV